MVSSGIMASEQRFVDPEGIETVQLDWGTLKWMHTPETTGAEAFSAGLVVLEPGRGHEQHTHPDSEEVLYVLSGEGTQTVAEEERRVSGGDTISIPAGVEHSTINDSWEPLRFLAIYGPPGPEAEIRDSAEATVLPPGDIPEN
jgi:oxalate decarboxylase/phosphoglucose isomerase-like protein (cupin superfamily)